MPYIDQDERYEQLDLFPIFNREELASSMANCAKNGGQLNYMISVAISTWLEEKGLNYDTCQDILGMLAVIKAEFTAQVVIPYEKLKAAENGAGIYDWVGEEIDERWNKITTPFVK